MFPATTRKKCCLSFILTVLDFIGIQQRRGNAELQMQPVCEWKGSAPASNPNRGCWPKIGIEMDNATESYLSNDVLPMLQMWRK